MTEPLLVHLELRCSAAHAFTTWTERFGLWWPPGHTTSGDPDATVHLEPGLGGRIFERASDGREIDWGEVTAWDPPHRLGYLWHIRRPREQATDVLVDFEDADGGSRIQITHTGWERLGDEGSSWRDANRGGWAGLLPHFQAAAEAPVAAEVDVIDHRRIGIDLFNRTWDLMLLERRTTAEDDLMIAMVHASRYHWAQVGTPAHFARGEWQCSRVYAVLGRPEPSLHHARRSLAICEENDIGDWDLAFAYEALARAYAVAGDAAASADAVEKALSAAQAIAEEDDRVQLMSDLATIPGRGKPDVIADRS